MKPTLVLDFDGVIHSYTTPWSGATVVSDPPVEGAIEFLIEASNYFHIAIMSSRSGEPGGIEAMQDWLKDHWIDYGFDDKIELYNGITWPTTKPAAFLTLDDRAMCFQGHWPDPSTLKEFKPWNKRDPKAREKYITLLGDNIYNANGALDRLQVDYIIDKLEEMQALR